jgi:hypothetical protein
MADLTSRARAGDEGAFRDLVDRYRHELQVHCYRILRCLNVLCAHSRRITVNSAPIPAPHTWENPPEPTRMSDVPWLEPYPDMLGFRTPEAAEILDSTTESVTSALKRARATMAQNAAADNGHREPPPEPDSPQERELVRGLTGAYAAGDVNGIISLLTDDLWRQP